VSRPRILIVDDDPDILEVLGDRLAAQGYQIETARDGLAALEAIRADAPDLAILDLMMPRMGGMEVLRKIQEEGLDVTAMVVTAAGSVQRAVEAMKTGAYDFIMKPFDPQQVALVVGKALERAGLRRRNRILSSQLRERAPSLIGDSPAMRGIVATARRAAESRSTVLLLGESGTGKEVLARSVHMWSDRREAPFVAVNCVALSEELLESELFGHEKGSFTGAVQQKIGKFEQADTGTIFLDEIAEMKADLQAKLLRVLQDHCFERVGGTRSIEVDIRIIAATNRDLARSMQEGRFREDLYFRLNVITLQMPPLRQRRADVPLLTEYFLRKYSKEAKRRVSGVSPAALTLLQRYEWPGNVRELENVIERAVVLGEEKEIVPDDLPAYILEGGDADAGGGAFHDRVRHFKAQMIREALKETGGQQRRAAEVLGLNPTYLSRLMRSLGVRE
jgi:DNA-binding NtrC family response regulator